MGNQLNINLTNCKHTRVRTDGTVIYLINCPACITRVGKTDTKRKLGVAVLNAEVKWVKCLRCGYAPRTNVTGAHAPTAAKCRTRYTGAGTTRLAYVPDLSLSPMVKLIDERRRSCGIWKGLTATDLACAGAEVDDRCDRIYLPYLSMSGEPGEIIRLIPWEGERGEGREGYMGEGELRSTSVPTLSRTSTRTKVLMNGPNGPVHVPFAYGVHPVIVEGVADGLAIPPPYYPVVLLGTANWRKVVPDKDYILALDGDKAGRSTARALVRVLLKAKCKVSTVLMKEGTDPASVGREVMREKLEGRLDVPTLTVMLSSLGDTVCQNL